MPVRHNYQSATPNNAGSEVSSTRWNEDHVVTTLDLTGQTSDPASPVNGQIWYRSDINELRARIAGRTVAQAMTRGRAYALSRGVF